MYIYIHIYICLSHNRIYIILSHFNNHYEKHVLMHPYRLLNYIIFEYQHLTIVHLGTSIARLSSGDPTHLILKAKIWKIIFCHLSWAQLVLASARDNYVRPRVGGKQSSHWSVFSGPFGSSPPPHFIPSARAFARQDYTSENVIIFLVNSTFGRIF